MQEKLYSKIEGKGKPFLILHGFLGMSDNWKTLGVQFSELGYEVHLLDLRNHGRSFHSVDFNYQVMANDVVNYCAENNLQDIVLLGHSMGGKVAMQVATSHSSLVHKLIVADIGPKYYAPHHQSILAGLNAVDFSNQHTRDSIDATLQQYISDFGTRQFLLKSVYRKTSDTFAFRFNLEVFNDKISEIGKALETQAKFENETLFLRGEKSSYILDEDWLGITYYFPLAKLVTIKRAGHWLHAENPTDFYMSVVEFLK